MQPESAFHLRQGPVAYVRQIYERLGETVEFTESGNCRCCGKGVVWQTLGQLTWAFLYGIPSS